MHAAKGTRSGSTERHYRQFILIVSIAAAIAVAALACRDITAPIGHPRGSSRAAALNAPGLVHVTPDSMHGWVFIDDQQNVPCGDTLACRLVAGPMAPPLGNGSAELSATTQTDGLALSLADYAGTRFDDLTTLSYATYRASPDSANNLAIALQLNVDYDLTDAVESWQGRIVYEPYMTAGGSVVGQAWQSWDAKAGKWWGTKASVSVGGLLTPNRCVQSSPCTWTELLSDYPNIGIHSIYGAVVFKAGSGWRGFRGNVDDFTIGVQSSNTSFSFDVPPSGFHLTTTIGYGAISQPWAPDSVYAPGTPVSYAFATRPGWRNPVVIIDDTLASATGTILMTGDHTLEVANDSIYTYDGLQPLERSIADLTTSLLASSDKFTAAQSLLNFYLEQLEAGTNQDVLEKARSVAEYVVIDPIRDAAALEATDSALANHNFNIDIYPDGSLDVYDGSEPCCLASSSNIAPLGFTPLNSINLQTGTSGATSIHPFRRRSSISSNARSFPAVAKSSGSHILVPSASKFDLVTIGNPDANTDYTQVIYSNGVTTSLNEAHFDEAVLANYLRRVPQFAHNYTGITLHYNRNHAVQMKQYDTEHPCTAMALFELRLWNKQSSYALTDYAFCKGARFVKTFTSNDFVETANSRMELQYGSQPTNSDVDSLARLVRIYRERFDAHVILVGHSEGTIIDAQAARLVASQMTTPIETANRCIAALALAPATSKESYGLDNYHLNGLLAKGDIIHSLPGNSDNEWESFRTPLTTKLEQAKSGMEMFAIALDMHGVRTSYLTDEMSSTIVERMSALRRECLPGSADLRLNSSVAPPGSYFTGVLKLWNQNQRPLLGRQVAFNWGSGTGGHAYQDLDALSFRALVPSDSLQYVGAEIMGDLEVRAPIRVPVVEVPLRTYVEGRAGWQMIASHAGTQNSSYVPPPPTIDWDGSDADCDRIYPVAGEVGWSFDYKRKCLVNFKLDYVRPDSIPGGVGVAYVRALWTDTNGLTEEGPALEAICLGRRCMSGVVIEFLDQYGHVIGRSAAMSFPATTVLSSNYNF